MRIRAGLYRSTDPVRSIVPDARKPVGNPSERPTRTSTPMRLVHLGCKPCPDGGLNATQNFIPHRVGVRPTRRPLLARLPTPPANTYAANTNRSVSVATAPTHSPVANPADADAAAIVSSRRIAVASFPASCGLGTPKGKERRGDNDGSDDLFTHQDHSFR